jgi:hypothetical protein
MGDELDRAGAVPLDGLRRVAVDERQLQGGRARVDD